MDWAQDLEDSQGFQWDQANRDKSWLKHGVSPAECESVFFNEPLLVADDAAHPISKTRYYALGRTDAGRRLYVVFARRGWLIRVISARDMSRKERKAFARYEKENPEV